MPASGEAIFQGETMNCPKCNAAMEKVQVQEVEVDRCTGCKGIWFDASEQEDLRKIVGSEKVDSGDRARGKVMDSIRKVNCPVCHSPMIEMVDHKHPNVHFESCHVCYGIFFDAGEFTDYKERSILDYIHDFITHKS